jgi:cysteine-rich repeat protein
MKRLAFAVFGVCVVVLGSRAVFRAAIQDPPGALHGNGIIEPGEQCDDGNLLDGDGCSATGQVEQQCYDAGNVFS